MDVVFHDSDGLEAARIIRDSCPGAKLLILSASDAEEHLFRALKCGVSAYLLKTVKLSELAESIKLVANGESVLSPPLIKKLICKFCADPVKNRQLSSLTQREMEILQMAAGGASNKEIAERCYISVTTVKAHFRNILGKLEVKNRTGAVALIGASGLLVKRD
jgi:DNA-binding NarL/FixJ family response regulator